MKSLGIFSLLVTLGTVITFTTAQHMYCPEIVTREEWGARKTNLQALPDKQATYYVIHHTATDTCNSKDSCSAIMRSIQNYHMDSNKWDDIGYNWLIGGDGLVYEGRGWQKQGAHAQGFNDKSVGIAYIGTFTNKLPSWAALTNIHQLLGCGVSYYYVHPGYKLIGHRQATSTECPGNELYKQVKMWPRWEENP